MKDENKPAYLTEKETYLRDQFAVAALTGAITDDESHMFTRKNMENLAVDCYRMADAMLKAREERS